MKLVASKRELHETELKLVEKKKEALDQRKKLDAQWVELEEGAEKLKKTFREFDKVCLFVIHELYKSLNLILTFIDDKREFSKTGKGYQEEREATSTSS